MRACIRAHSVGRSLDPLPWRFFCFCCCFFFFVFLRRARRVNDTRPEQIPNGSLRAFHFPAVRAASLSPSLSPLRPPPASPARRPRRSYAPSRRFVPVHAHPATTITSSIFIQERTSSQSGKLYETARTGGFAYFDRVRIGDISAIDESFFPRSINLTFPRLRSIFQIMCIKLNNFGILKKERNISKVYALQVHASFLPVMFNLQKLTETANSKPYWTRKVRPLPLSRNCKLQKCNPDDPRASVDACAGRTLVTGASPCH